MLETGLTAIHPYNITSKITFCYSRAREQDSQRSLSKVNFLTSYTFTPAYSNQFTFCSDLT